MKKVVVMFSIGLIFVSVTGYFSYCLGFNNGMIKETKAECPVCFEGSDVFGKIDYPLIEIIFDTESEWLVIDRSGLFTEHEVFSISQSSQDLQFNKEDLRVLTFPEGRGTTPKGIIYVYKDGVLIKRVPYIESHFESDALKDAFQQVTKDEVEIMIKSKLPPPI
ncbi:MAG: hypothetical protein LBE22_02745 [Azoarcus sp.]|jgi:hypothetical protein|nr:hypothetical protein [Azoarcus sp.]